MSGFYNPYSPKPQLLSGLMGLGTDALSIMSLLKLLKGGQGEQSIGQTPVGGGTSGPMGGMAANNILKQAPQSYQDGPQFTQSPPPQANMIPQGGQTGQGGIDPTLLAYLKKMMMGGGGQFGQGPQFMG
jgi:hypothetical protein